MTDASNDTRRLSAAQWRGILAEVPLFFDVTSGSMAPTFCAGEQVRIRPLRPGEPHPGQVLACFHSVETQNLRAACSLITHRYVGGGLCRGDNTLVIDPPVGPDDMVGIVDAVKRNGDVVPLDDRIPLRTRIRRVRLHLGQALRALKAVLRAGMPNQTNP